MPRLDPVMTMRLHWLIWRLRLKGWLLRRFWPHTYQAVHNPIWVEGGREVYHDWGGGFIVVDDSGGFHVVEFGEVIDYVRGN